MAKEEKKEKKEKICSNCIHFKRNEDGTIYSKGAGYCECIHDKIVFNKKGQLVELKTQIFSHFHCGNGNFSEK